MHDTPPPIPDDPTARTPFGAGIPAEPHEPVRLAPGERRGPALDVRGEAAPKSYPHDARAHASRPTGAGDAASASSSSASAGGPSFATAPPTGAAFASSEAASASAGAGTPPPGPPPSPRAGAATFAPHAKPAGRWWIGLAHLSFLIPFPPGVVITAALWIWRRDRDPLMADQGREALNMQLTFWLAIWILGSTCLGTPLVPFVYVIGGVLCVLATIAAANGDKHRYPWVFRFLN